MQVDYSVLIIPLEARQPKLQEKNEEERNNKAPEGDAQAHRRVYARELNADFTFNLAVRLRVVAQLNPIIVANEEYSLTATE